MAKVNSRQKGKRGERLAVQFLRGLGFNARRGQQHRGGPDSPDVIVEGYPVHIEVKLDGGVDLGTKALKEAWDQAWDDAPAGTLPIVLWKPSRRCWRASWAGDFGLTTIYGAGAIQMLIASSGTSQMKPSRKGEA